MVMQSLLKIYSHVLIKGDPLASIEKFEAIRKTFIRGLESNVSIIERAQNSVKIEILHIYKDRDFLTYFTYATVGSVEDLVKQAGGKNISTDIHEFDKGYEFEIKWE